MRHACWRAHPRDRELSLTCETREICKPRKSPFRRDAETIMPEACATQSDLPPTTAAFTICAMLDIRLIREKPDFVRERLAARGGGDEAKIEEVLQVDAERRKTETELQRLQSER